MNKNKKIIRLALITGGILLTGFLVWMYFVTPAAKLMITLRSGNCMPIIDPVTTTCKKEPYEVASTIILKQPAYSENKHIVAKFDNVKGTLYTKLPAGEYNMYVMYKNQEYCNSFGSQPGSDCVFKVENGKITNYEFVINNALD